MDIPRCRGFPPARDLYFPAYPQFAAARRDLGCSHLAACTGCHPGCHGVHDLQPSQNAWNVWESLYLPTGVSEEAKQSVWVHPSVDRKALIDAVRSSRVLLFLSHKAEAFVYQWRKPRPWEFMPSPVSRARRRLLRDDGIPDRLERGPYRAHQVRFHRVHFRSNAAAAWGFVIE